MTKNFIDFLNRKDGYQAVTIITNGVDILHVKHGTWEMTFSTPKDENTTMMGKIETTKEIVEAVKAILEELDEEAGLE